MRQNTENRLRKEIAQEAAKLVAVDGLEDYLQAKKKAADQLGIYDKRVYPSNSEIEVALIEYQSLFQNNQQKDELLELRKTAYKTMVLLKDYQPRLVGPVLTGTANQYSEITIHLFCDTPELVSLFLEQEGIPTSICERRIKLEKNKILYFTSFKFLAGDINVVLTVMPLSYIKTLPLDPVTGNTMKRAKTKDVLRLIE